jgi:type IX secretion system PorP/SprF family membrane protein
MTKRFTLTTILAGLLFVTDLLAQDVHFSQFYATPLMQNPAFTGFFDGNYRMTAIARSQWRSVTNEPYRTVGGSLDWNIASGARGSKDMFGLGFNVLSDRAGDGRFTTNRFDASAAYSKALDRFNQNFFSTGIQASYTSAYLDYSQLTFDENFQDGQTTENLAYNTTKYADVSAGMQFTRIVDKENNYTVGAATYHLNEPTQTFLGDVTSKVQRKFVLNASSTIGWHGLKWFPKINYSKQGSNSELNFGLFTRYAIPKAKDYGVYFGLLHRWKDAVILVSRFDADDLSFTFSYDFNYSKLAKVSHGLGGPEVSVQYIGAFKHKPNKKVFCPIF